jgi:hypothetical protein
MKLSGAVRTHLNGKMEVLREHLDKKAGRFVAHFDDEDFETCGQAREPHNL